MDFQFFRTLAEKDAREETDDRDRALLRRPENLETWRRALIELKLKNEHTLARTAVMKRAAILKVKEQEGWTRLEVERTDLEWATKRSKMVGFRRHIEDRLLEVRQLLSERARDERAAG